MTIGLILFVAGAVTQWYDAVFLWVGAIIGILLPDLEYILYAYFIDPSVQTSSDIRAFLRSKNIKGFVSYIDTKEYSFGEMSVHSVLFLFVLMIFVIYAGAGNAFILVKGLALSMYITLVYSAFIELYKTKTLKRWFWMLKISMNTSQYSAFLIVMFLTFIFLFTFII
jgi:hypothetical protein